VLLDLTRTVQPRTIQLAGEADLPAAPAGPSQPEAMPNVTVELGAPANPPGFDENLTGLSPADVKTFTVTYPAEYEVKEMAGGTVLYDVTVKGIRRKELLPLDDEFAKEVSDVDTLDALRTRITDDMQHEAEHEADHKVRHELLQQLSGPSHRRARCAGGPRDRAPARGARAPPDGAGRRSDEGEHRLAAIPRRPSVRPRRNRSRARCC